MSSPQSASWEAHVEVESGRTYYYNAATGVSQWEIPEDWEQGSASSAGGEGKGGVAQVPAANA